MKTRIISAAILAPLIVLDVYIGGILLKYTLLVLSLIGLHEFYKALNGEHKAINYFSYGFTIIYYLLLDSQIYSFAIPISIFTIYIIFLFTYLVFTYPNNNIKNIETSVMGILYIPIMFSYVYLIRQMEFGIYYVWLIFITAFATDTFAYFCGVFLGKNKLIPHLSPNKTIEGSIGGILGCVICCIIYTYFIQSKIPVSTPYLILSSAIIGFGCSIFAQIGDLTASSIKRYTGVKDFGKLIPGHGGIIDRFDSILFTAPILFMILHLV